MREKKRAKHIKLTSHPDVFGDSLIPINWGSPDPIKRGPVVATVTNLKHHNVIGTHSGSFSIYRALAVAAGRLDPGFIPDFTNTAPMADIGPHASWSDCDKIVSMDPYGHIVTTAFDRYIKKGIDIRPSIAITSTTIKIPEVQEAIRAGRLKPDNKWLSNTGEMKVTKAAIEPVWYLPGIAKRFNIDETTLRQTLFENTGGMFSELITRPDLHVFLPPMEGMSVYIFGDVDTIADPSKELTCRVHDECNGSDVFGSDFCTCRPYLTYGIELGIETAMRGGCGLIVYNHKEGRALGEVVKFLVYNARKRYTDEDKYNNYFVRTECVAGIQDARSQELMPDVLNWLGVKKIDRLVSMNNMKYNAIVSQGISVEKRVSIPEELIPSEANVEIRAKRAAGYFSG